MRKLLVETFLSLDGVMQAPGGPEEDDEGGFGFGGWIAPLWDEDLDRAQLRDTMGNPFDLLLGRRTYEIFAGYWPTAPDETRGKPLNDATKFVVSRSSPSLDWGPAELIGGDAARAVADLKETDGPDLQVFGSGNLLQTLIPAGLIDEYRLMTFPITIGKGSDCSPTARSLLRCASPRVLSPRTAWSSPGTSRPVSSQLARSRSVHLGVAGAAALGTFAHPRPTRGTDT